jgi:hypothetical protein
VGVLTGRQILATPLYPAENADFYNRKANIHALSVLEKTPRQWGRMGVQGDYSGYFGKRSPSRSGAPVQGKSPSSKLPTWPLPNRALLKPSQVAV